MSSLAPLRRRAALGVVSLGIASLLWLPSVHLFFKVSVTEEAREEILGPLADGLEARHLRLWSDPESRRREIEAMRRRNAEWDFMGRSFLCWALANRGLRSPARKAELLDVIDRILEETLSLERDEGFTFFLLPYAKRGAYEQKPARCLFVDGEIALMLGLRRLLSEKEEYRAPFLERVETMVRRMREGPVLSCESYPNECWMFDNTIALAAIRFAGLLDGRDYGDFLRAWVDTARKKLVHPETGLLISSYTYGGQAIDGPEGSTIWMAAHCLELVDEEFARDQYTRARRELGRNVLGFGVAREWPSSWRGPMDVDSGAVIPLVDAGAASSGLAIVGAAAFSDWDYLSSLLTSLDMAAFPLERGGELRYCASNQVGDAVLLYALSQGPAWKLARGKEGGPR